MKNLFKWILISISILAIGTWIYAQTAVIGIPWELKGTDVYLGTSASTTGDVIFSYPGNSSLMYNTGIGTANYERAYLKWDSNVFKIGTEKGGAGTARNMEIIAPLLTITGIEKFNNSAVFTSEVDNGVAGANKTIDWTAGNKQFVTLTAATLTTFAFTAPSGLTSLTLRIVQAAGGTGTTAWPATVKWPAGVVHPMTAAANAVDIISLYYNGTNYYSTYGLDFK